MGDRVDVSVLVPVLNEEEHIRDTVSAMLAQRFDGEIEFLFMDGNSEDRTREILEELASSDARVHVLENPARQTATALNIGLREARGEFVARMDAHSHYPSHYIAGGVERLKRGDTAWVIGPAVPRGSGKWSRRVALALGSWLGVGGSRKWGGTEEVEVGTGVFTGIWRRSTLETLGGWDEEWPVNQDSELAARVLESGGRIICLPELAAEYVPRNSLRSLARQYSRFGYYRAKTSRRHPRSMRRSHLLPVGLVFAAIGSLAAPGVLRKASRSALGLYVTTLIVGSATTPGRRDQFDLVALPVVFATMHGAWGLGFLAGVARFGPPLAPFARAAGPRASTARHPPG